MQRNDVRVAFWDALEDVYLVDNQVFFALHQLLVDDFHCKSLARLDMHGLPHNGITPLSKLLACL